MELTTAQAACAHHTHATLACSECGNYRRGCSACGLCLDCLAPKLVREKPPASVSPAPGGFGGLS